ncbi:hypothetical protein B0H14DRAFT_407321 [Mycena olivaceomarginata]|nr:hypothetical protein B0H14DRAFT_407321 [Mycena olivaceomarginata]
MRLCTCAPMSMLLFQLIYLRCLSPFIIKSRQLKSVAISLLALSPPSLPKLSDVVRWQIRSLRLLRSAAGRSTPTDYGAAEVEVCGLSSARRPQPPYPIRSADPAPAGY